jgi:hypothetical protein
MPAADRLRLHAELSARSHIVGTRNRDPRFPSRLLAGTVDPMQTNRRSSNKCQGPAGRFSSDDRGKVLTFPPKPNTANVTRLLDLSKYERPRQKPDEFKVRMTENIAALIVLGLLIGVATTDFSDIEQLQQCTTTWPCMR